MAKSSDFLIGVIVGSAIGAAAALMYAPASGAETRENLRLKAEDAQRKCNELADMAKQRSNELMEQARAKATEVSERAQAAVERGKHAVETQKTAIRSAVDAGKQAYQEKASTLREEVAQDTAPATGESAA
jgi:gas vesicle protein